MVLQRPTEDKWEGERGLCGGGDRNGVHEDRLMCGEKCGEWIFLLDFAGFRVGHMEWLCVLRAVVITRQWRESGGLPCPKSPRKPRVSKVLRGSQEPPGGHKPDCSRRCLPFPSGNWMASLGSMNLLRWPLKGDCGLSLAWDTSFS